MGGLNSYYNRGQRCWSGWSGFGRTNFWQDNLFIEPATVENEDIATLDISHMRGACVQYSALSNAGARQVRALHVYNYTYTAVLH